MTRYLTFIFPIASCAISLFFITTRFLLYHISQYRSKAYKPIPTVVVDFPSDEGGDDSESFPDDEESDLMLYKAVSRTTDIGIEEDRPRGKILLDTIEILALVGEVAANAAAVASISDDPAAKNSAIARMSSWIYILILAVSRLFSSSSKHRSIPDLWNHTASLYALQWLFVVFIFRSVLVHPPSNNTGRFVIIDFSLSTLLAIMMVSIRKGNKSVFVQHEEDLTPPKDQFASLLSLASFSWMDSLIWQGYKKPLAMEDVWNLKPDYHATAVLVNFRQIKKTSKLAWRLFRFFDRVLLIQGAWTVLSSIFTFFPTWLLKLILHYVEDPTSTPRNAAWLYVILLFACGVIQAIGDGQSLWIGRDLSVKLRAIIVGELYTKALRRKAGAFVGPSQDESDQPKSKGKSDPSKQKKTGDEDDEESETQANLGKIINLMAIDSFKISEICAYLHFLWASVPSQLLIAVYFLYKILGYSSLAGIVMTALIAPINVYVASRFKKVQDNILSSTDARIHSTNEVLQNIRIIKYFAWEQRFEGIIDEKREVELKYLRKRFVLWSVAATVFYGTPLLTTLFTFFIFTVVEGKALIPSIAFPALSMFSLLRVPLDRLADMAVHVLESKVSIDRVEEFLSEEETGKYHQLRHCENAPEPRISLDKATLTWGSSGKGKSGSATASALDAFRLINVDVNFRIGRLNIIAGPTGSGKTSILMALLGEMNLLEGSVSLPGGTSDRADLRVDMVTSLTESVAYCAQEAWLVNDTIKENIVFASTFDENRYQAVIKACSLERDFQILDSGDQTMVGEKGISLSGGQKQRISLARAIYSSARHLLLDDCLSAVDSHTAKHIFRHALMGPLMVSRTCILVTHNVSLVLPQSEYAIFLDNGRITAQGTPNELVASGVIGEEAIQSGSTSQGTSQLASRAPSNLEEIRNEFSDARVANGTAKPQKKVKNTGGKASSLGAEEKLVGSVPMSTIFMYLRAMGPWYFWVAAILSFFLHQIASLAPNLWVREWANSYQSRGIEPRVVMDDNTTTNGWGIPSFTMAKSPALFWETDQKHIQSATLSENDGVSLPYYLVVYTVLSLIYIVITLVRELIFFWGSLHASRKIHAWLLRTVAHAKFRFFDSTPLGRIMNRFSKDIEAIDQEVAGTAIGTLHCLAAIIMIVILISIITPGFLIAGIFITIMYAALGAFYLSASRDLKRLESIQRSPLYQQFGETLNGVVTIRAYGDGARFILDNHSLINIYNRPYIYLWGSNRWLSFRVDVTGALVSFFAAMFIMLNVGNIDAGAAGLSMTYAITFTENILWFVRLYAENQQNMNSVERVEEYMKVEQEADAIIPDSRPPGVWPSKGQVKFVDYSTRYRSDLDLVLKRVTFTVEPGERVGIVGRTGAGKSSLALALFRGLEAETGSIIIDDIDIGLIGLKDLRQSITIVPQDPTLFTGTIRNNLDPFGLFTDEEIFTALRQVHLIGPATATQTESSPTTESGPASNASLLMGEDGEGDDHHHAEPSVTDPTVTPATSSSPPTISHFQDNKNVFLNLDSPISESGSNLSQGQRQLLCLARALLKSPKVLLMDEATASIDYATDAKIQDTLRELKGNNTILTIAHRLQTIIDYDKVLVLDHGEVMEYEDPWHLINKEDGIFRSMCENTGNLDSLIEGAKKAWEQKRLVDDS